MNPTLEKVKTDVIQKLGELSLWEICVYGSLAFHLFLFLTYYYITHKEKEFVDSEQLEMNVEVDIQDIPPELLGGETSPTHKDPNEWVEGANEEGKDPDPNDIKENEISGEGTDKDGFLFAFYGDKAPTPIIDFSLRDYFPENARAQGISDAMIYLEVQVDEKGNLINAKVIKSSIRGYGFEEAAVKVIRLARWSPGYAKGRPTRMNHRVPVHFELDDN